MKPKNKEVAIESDKANELYLYGKVVMDLPPGQLLACACFTLAMVLKTTIPESLWKDQMKEIHRYLEEELLPHLNVTTKRRE